MCLYMHVHTHKHTNKRSNKQVQKAFKSSIPKCGAVGIMFKKSTTNIHTIRKEIYCGRGRGERERDRQWKSIREKTACGGDRHREEWQGSRRVIPRAPGVGDDIGHRWQHRTLSGP